LLTPEKIVKLVDFGISGIASNFNVDKLDVGSLGYMAPELLSGKANKISPAIDIWALGVILFGLVKGFLLLLIILGLGLWNFAFPKK